MIAPRAAMAGGSGVRKGAADRIKVLAFRYWIGQRGDGKGWQEALWTLADGWWPMPSNSLLQWRGVRAAVLDEIEAAHAHVGGTARGRRYATQQINRAYAVLLSSEFQGFCRDLYSECMDHVVATAPVTTQGVIRTQFLWARSLDRGNPQAGGIDSDFGRFALPFWDEVYALNALNDRRRVLLDELMGWRNAIAHNDFDRAVFGPHPVLHFGEVQAWRSALNSLCRSFDTVMRSHLNGMLGAEPWPA